MKKIQEAKKQNIKNTISLENKLQQVNMQAVNSETLKTGQVLFDTGVMDWPGLPSSSSASYRRIADFKKYDLNLREIYPYLKIIPTMESTNRLNYNLGTDSISDAVFIDGEFLSGGGEWFGPTKQAKQASMENPFTGNSQIYAIALGTVIYRSVYAATYSYWILEWDGLNWVYVKRQANKIEIEDGSGSVYNISTFMCSPVSIQGGGSRIIRTRTTTWDPSITEDPYGDGGGSGLSNIPSTNTYETVTASPETILQESVDPPSFSDPIYPEGQWTLVYREPWYLNLHLTRGQNLLPFFQYDLHSESGGALDVPTLTSSTAFVEMHPYEPIYTFKNGTQPYRFYNPYMTLPPATFRQYEDFITTSQEISSEYLPYFKNFQVFALINDIDEKLIIHFDVQKYITVGGTYTDYSHTGATIGSGSGTTVGSIGDSANPRTRLQIVYVGPEYISKMKEIKHETSL